MSVQDRRSVRVMLVGVVSMHTRDDERACDDATESAAAKQSIITV